MENNPKTPLLKRITNFLGLQRSITAVLSMVILVGLGEKMAERFLPLYLVAMGGGALSVGLLNGLDNLLSALYALPGGYASDKLGYKRALLVFNLIAMGGYLVVIIFPSWQAAIIGAVLFISWSAISLPATMGLVSTVLPKNKRTMGVSMHSLVRRIPMALGPVIGGALIGVYGEVHGVRLALIAAFVLAGAALIFQQFMIQAPPQQKDGEGQLKRYGLSLISTDLRNLLTADILVRFCEQIPYAFVVLWCVSQHGITTLQFGVLTTVEMVTAMLVYIPVAYLADRSTKKPFVVTTFVFFTLFPLILLVSQTFWVMVLAFIIRGLKEFGEPTRKALIMDLAPEGRKAATFGLYYLIRDIVVSVAAFGGAFLWMVSPSTNFWVAFGFGVLGTIYFAVFGRDLGREAVV
ncbi:MAG: MFS transporter [Chloroflexota bacterium]